MEKAGGLLMVRTVPSFSVMLTVAAPAVETSINAPTAASASTENLPDKLFMQTPTKNPFAPAKALPALPSIWPTFGRGQRRTEIFGQFGGYDNLAIFQRMLEGEAAGVQGKALDERSFLLILSQFKFSLEFRKEECNASIIWVDCQRIAHGFEMHANLVPASGNGEDLHQGDALEAFHNDPFGAGIFGFQAADDHAVLVVGIAADGEIDAAGFMQGRAADQGPVLFQHGACAKLLGNDPLRICCQGEKDNPRRICIYAMNDQRLGASSAASALSICKRLSLRPRPGSTARPERLLTATKAESCKMIS